MMNEHALRGAWLWAVLLAAGCGEADRSAHAELDAVSPYVDQRTSPIRGLSATEITDLSEGRGMGLARAAELNDFPGPRHTLDLREQLELSPEVTVQLEQSFERMNRSARELGAQILEREQALSQAFAAASIDAQQLEQRVQELAGLYGRLRALHLAAHLETRQLLTPHQIARYSALRGYTEAGASDHAAQHGG